MPTSGAGAAFEGRLGDGHTSALLQAGDIVAPVGLEVCDGSHSLGVMKKVILKSGAVRTPTHSQKTRMCGAPG